MRRERCSARGLGLAMASIRGFRAASPSRRESRWRVRWRWSFSKSALGANDAALIVETAGTYQIVPRSEVHGLKGGPLCTGPRLTAGRRRGDANHSAPLHRRGCNVRNSQADCLAKRDDASGPGAQCPDHLGITSGLFQYLEACSVFDVDWMKGRSVACWRCRTPSLPPSRGSLRRFMGAARQNNR